MADNSQVTPLSNTLPEFARRKAADAIQQTGRSLPCSVVSVSGSIVSVKFEVNSVFTLPNVTVPVAGPEYIRMPIQPGDKGFVIPADAYLGGVSGIGGGTADLTQLANLTTLVFDPIGNRNWKPTSNPNAVVIYGVQGGGVSLFPDVRFGPVKFVMTDTGFVIVGDMALTGNLSVTGAITATGDITAGFGTADQVGVRTHLHLNVTSGTARSGPPAPGT